MIKINPVFLRGVKSRMRGVRAPILISVYLGIVLGFFTLIYMSMTNNTYYGMNSRPLSIGSDMVENLYSILSMILFAVIVLMVPSMNAGAIASEREKQTLDLLLCSPLSASKIVMGKIGSNMAFVTFLLVLVLPFFSILYLFGTVSILNFVILILFLAVSAYACASVASFFSCLMKKTSVATILSYVALLVFVIVTIIIGGILQTKHWENLYASGQYQNTEAYMPFVWRINPIMGLMEIAAEGASGTAGMFGSGINIMSSFMYSFNFGGYGMGMEYSGMRMYVSSALLMIGVSVILNIASAALIKPVNKLSIRK